MGYIILAENQVSKYQTRVEKQDIIDAKIELRDIKDIMTQIELNTREIIVEVIIE